MMVRWAIVSIVIAAVSLGNAVAQQASLPAPGADTPPIETLLDRLQGKGHEEAAEQIIERGAPALPAILTLPEHYCFVVRQNALDALRELDPDGGKTIPVFLRALENSRMDIRFDAARGLVERGTELDKAVPVLKEGFGKPDPSWGVEPQSEPKYRAALTLLGRGLYVDGAVENLLLGMEQHGYPGAPGPDQILEVLKHADAAKVIPALLDGLGNPSAELRWQVLTWLRALDPEGAVANPVLLRSLDDARPLLRLVAATELLKRGVEPERAAAVAAPLLPDRGLDFHARFAAASALTERGLHMEAVSPVWRELLVDGAEDVRRQAYYVVEGLRKDPEKADLLKEVLTELQGEVRDGQTKASLDALLGRIGPAGIEYELVKTEIPNANTGFETSNSSDFDKHYEFSLRLSGQDELIFLARRYEGNEVETHTDDIGFNEETLRMDWLDPDKLLHVSWETINQGSGHYTVQSHLILKRDAGQWRELYRDSQTSAERGGWESADYCDYHYSYEPDSSVLTIRATEDAHTTIPEDDPFVPFADKIEQSDGSVVYMRGYTKITEWRYRLNGSHLEYLSGKRCYDLKDQEKTLQAVAALVSAVEQVNAEEALKTIQRLNPTLAAQGKAKGLVTTADDVPAHVPDGGVYYRS